MKRAIIQIPGEWRIDQIRVFRSDEDTVAEITFADGEKLSTLRLLNPQPRDALLEIFNGCDAIDVFDRNDEDGFHRDFGRYRIEYFVDDLFTLDADRVEFESIS